jgi:predicted hotdog family 3-hydroxylacyl-ACP dehydratase
MREAQQTVRGAGIPSLIERDELITLLPHKGKMFLLSRLTDYDLEKRSIAAEYDITEDCIFYDPDLGGIPSWVGFELMAQSISALSGLADRELGEGPKPGFILSVSALELAVPILKAGTTVRIRIAEKVKIDAVFTFDCAVFQGEEPAAQAKVTVMDVRDLSLFDKEELSLFDKE